MSLNRPIQIASRGSALALVQANLVLAQCRQHFPGKQFALKIIKTTGDKLQTATLKQVAEESTKGLFTKELEIALLNGEADLAVHSLKDLPTDLPAGLMLGAVSERADVRDVLIYRNAVHFQARAMQSGSSIGDFPISAVIATTSTRRKAQLLALRPDLRIIPIRGNVGTRLQKLATQSDLDGIALAAAGLERLGFRVDSNGYLTGEGTPVGLSVVYLTVDEMLPCVGQAALGIEIRENDPEIATVVEKLNDPNTFACVSAERAFLQTMGGGCLSPVAALANVKGAVLRMRVISFKGEKPALAEGEGPLSEAVQLGRYLAGRTATA
jgi:hydroxymethylbilane synthase